MSTYLVTGVAGFIASRVAEMLLADGHTVVGIDNLNDYYDVRLKHYRLGRIARQAGVSEAEVIGQGLSADGWKNSAPITNNLKPITLSSERFEFRVLDIENIKELDELFATRKFDAVFNLAARAGVRYSLLHPELYRRTNVLGEENVLKCQVKYGVQKHVVASSSSVYAGCPMPFTEDATLGQIQSPYAETKRQAEVLARDYHLKHGLDVSVLRYFTVFGPAGRPDMAPFRFIKWIDEGQPIELFGDGTQARDFTYVDDIARGTVFAVKPLGYQVINLGGGRNPISLQTVIAFIEKALGKEAKINGQPFHLADIKETWADITKAKRLLSWSPTVTPQEGFQRTVDWHVANRSWLKDIKL